jgi:hypothetical protein
MTQNKLASTVNEQISRIERQVAQISKLASAEMDTGEAVAGLQRLVANLHFYNPGDQSKNDAWVTPGGTVDTVPDGGASYPASVTNPKTASGPRMAVLTANADLAETILNQISVTNTKVNALVAAGRRFNASKAKAALHKVATDVQEILTNADLAMPYVGQDLQKLAANAAHLHGLFASAKV